MSSVDAIVGDSRLRVVRIAAIRLSPAGAAEQSLAADGANDVLVKNFIAARRNADRAPPAEG